MFLGVQTQPVPQPGPAGGLLSELEFSVGFGGGGGGFRTCRGAQGPSPQGTHQLQTKRCPQAAGPISDTCPLMPPGGGHSQELVPFPPP